MTNVFMPRSTAASAIWVPSPSRSRQSAITNAYSRLVTRCHASAKLGTASTAAQPLWRHSLYGGTASTAAQPLRRHSLYGGTASTAAQPLRRSLLRASCAREQVSNERFVLDQEDALAGHAQIPPN